MKFKNPLDYTDAWTKQFGELVKFADRKNKNLPLYAVFALIGVFVMCSVLAYSYAPHFKSSIDNPYSISGVITDFKNTHSARSGRGCKIFVVGDSKTLSFYSLNNVKSNVEHFGELFCSRVERDFKAQKCVTIKLVERRFLSEYGYCDGSEKFAHNKKHWEYILFRRNMLWLTAFISFLLVLLILFSLNREYEIYKNKLLQKEST